MRRIVLLLLLVVFITTPLPAKAGGIPTFDIANTVSMALDYLTQIMKYKEQITQSSMESAQYAQMLRDYMQTLQEYHQYLSQIESLKNKISAGDWKLLVDTLAYYGEKANLWVLVDSDPKSATYEDDMDAILSQYGYVPRDPREVEAEARALGIWTDQYAEQVRQEWAQYEIYKDKFRMNAQVADQSKKRAEEAIPEHAGILARLGDGSDLATLQAMAYQNQTMMNQLEAIVQVQNAILYHMESEQARRAAQSARWKEKERKRLANRETYKPTGQSKLIDF